MSSKKDITSKELFSEVFLIPPDVICEIAQIILRAGFSHAIIGVKENRRLVVLCIEYDNQSEFHREAINNINEILKSYHEIYWNGDERISWREY